MVSKHHCLHLWICRRLCPCHFIWVLARLGLFIVCCWVFLMWHGKHCLVNAWLSNVPQMGFFWKTCQINHTKACLLAFWHQCPYKTQAWGCYTPETPACWWGVFPDFVVVSVPDSFVCVASWEQQWCCEHEKQWWVRRGVCWLSQNLAVLFLGKGCIVGHPLLSQKLQAYLNSFPLPPFTGVKFFQYGGKFFSGAQEATG